MANNIDVKDASGITRSVKTTETSGVNVPHHNVDAIAGALPSGENIVGAVRSACAASFAAGKVAIGTTATQIVAARAGRKGLLIVQEGTTLVRVSGAGVATSGASTGVPLPGVQYSSLPFDTEAAVFGIVASDSQDVTYVEFF